MTNLVRLLMATALCASSFAAHADHCYGSIRALIVDNSGNVTLYASYGGWYQVCNVNSTWKGVDIATCKSWVALLTTLRVTQEQADISYSSTACTALPHDANAPAPYYVGYYLP